MSISYSEFMNLAVTHTSNLVNIELKQIQKEEAEAKKHKGISEPKHENSQAMEDVFGD